MPPTTMDVLVADDEPVARRRLLRLLKEDPTIRVVAQCSGGRSAVEQIREHSPDLVFLDIQMPDLDGFGVISEIGVAKMPAVIFVTAFDKYAIKAFDVHAVDYLLKPFEHDRFIQALERARDHLKLSAEELAQREERLRGLLTDLMEQRTPPNAESPRHYHERIGIRLNGSIRILPVAEVDWFETDGNYIRVHAGRNHHLIRNTANRLQQELDPRMFARIHRRYLVNLERVVEVEPWFGGDAIVVLRDGKKLRLSRNYREEFVAKMLTDHSGGADRSERPSSPTDDIGR